MRKQFLQNLSTEFPNALNCSSIRINAEEEENANLPKNQRKNNLLAVGPKLKKYAENDLVGFQMSLQISDNGEKCLELMRSKSTRDYKRLPQERQQLSKKQKQAPVIHPNSLYHTTSFDEITMNITTNTRNPNTTNMYNHIDETEEENMQSKVYSKPNEHGRFKENGVEQKMMINVKNSRNLKRSEDQDHHRTSQALLEALKCSKGGEESSRFIDEPSYEQPYFKVTSDKHFTPKFDAQTNKLFIQDHRRDLKKVISVDTFKSNEKKLTLRDYMYLSKLSGKNREKSSECQSPLTPKFSRTSMNTSRSRRKLISSNAQVMQQLKKEVTTNIELVRGNMNLLFQYIQKYQVDDEIDGSQLMKMYSLARILRDKIVSGNDELVLMLQQGTKG